MFAVHRLGRGLVALGAVAVVRVRKLDRGVMRQVNHLPRAVIEPALGFFRGRVRAVRRALFSQLARPGLVALVRVPAPRAADDAEGPRADDGGRQASLLGRLFTLPQWPCSQNENACTSCKHAAAWQALAVVASTVQPEFPIPWLPGTAIG